MHQDLICKMQFDVNSILSYSSSLLEEQLSITSMLNIYKHKNAFHKENLLAV